MKTRLLKHSNFREKTCIIFDYLDGDGEIEVFQIFRMNMSHYQLSIDENGCKV